MNKLLRSAALSCPALFILFYLQIERVHNTILQRISVIAARQCGSLNATIANHWMLTLDILYLFARMIPIRYHRIQTTV